MWENYSKNQIKSIIFNDNFISMFFLPFSLSHSQFVAFFQLAATTANIYFHSFRLRTIDKNDDHFAEFITAVSLSLSLCMHYAAL